MKNNNQHNIQIDDLDRAYQEDKKHYSGACFTNDYLESNKEQLVGNMMLCSHSLEKGLTNDNFEIGHGISKVHYLTEMVRVYHKANYDLSDPAFINSLSILKKYLKIYTENGNDLINDIIPIVSHVASNIHMPKQISAGEKTVLASSKKDNSTKNYKEIVESRASVRSFSKNPIKQEDIDEALNIAQRAPSACNRQATRVYEVSDPRIIEKIMIIQEGFSYSIPPQRLLLIVADDHNFSGVGERNQGYIDGGLYAMALMLALEYKSLAACPLHASFSYEKEKLFRGLLDIPDNEKLIVFLAVGSFRSKFKVAKSYRYPVSYIKKTITQINEQYLVESHNDEINEAEAYKNEPIIQRVRNKVRIRTRIKHLKQKTRIRTRYKKAVDIKKNDIFLYETLKNLYTARLFNKRVFVFGAPFHSNLGDQAQSYCITQWLRKHYRGHKIVLIDTISARNDGYKIVNMVKKIAKPHDIIALHSGYHTTDLWKAENILNLTVIKAFPDRKIIVFPQTIHFQEKSNLIETAKVYNAHGNIYLMPRDDESYRVAKKYFGKTHIKTMPDVVTTLIGTEIINTNTERNKGILMCFRNDKESKYGKELDKFRQMLDPITTSIDLVDTTLDIDPYYISKNRKGVLRQYLSMMADYNLVITDRYHGTVFSVISNTPVIVLGSTDHKLSSGVKWFTDNNFNDLVYFAESIDEALKIANKIYSKYDFSKKKPQVFNEKYWDKLTWRLDER